jgi:hypothetical protein
VQLDCAALCEEVRARGEVDRLAGCILAGSTDVVEQQGLTEALVSLWLGMAAVSKGL